MHAKSRFIAATRRLCSAVAAATAAASVAVTAVGVTAAAAAVAGVLLPAAWLTFEHTCGDTGRMFVDRREHC